MRTFASALALAATLGLAAPAYGHEAGDWLVRFGGSLIDPKSDNGSLDAETGIEVDDQWGVTFNVTYMYTANIGVELLAALPYKHDISLVDETSGETAVFASVKHLPPTLSLQYHFMPDQAFQPYVGAGLNFTLFSSEKFKGEVGEILSDSGLSLDVDSSSFGLAAQIGFDYKINDQWFVNFDVRWIDIDTEATLSDGVDSIKVDVNIDPIVYGLHVGYRF
jgi:outer membrane protein